MSLYDVLRPSVVMRIRRSSAGIPSLSPLPRKRVLSNGIRGVIFLNVGLARVLRDSRRVPVQIGRAHCSLWACALKGSAPQFCLPPYAGDAAMNEICEPQTNSYK